MNTRVCGFSSKLSNLPEFFFCQSLGQINDTCKFSEFLDAVNYSPGAKTFSIGDVNGKNSKLMDRP